MIFYILNIHIKKKKKNYLNKVVVCAEKIINILPQLWDSSGEEQYTFKSAIIVILTKFVIVYNKTIISRRINKNINLLNIYMK